MIPVKYKQSLEQKPHKMYAECLISTWKETQHYEPSEFKLNHNNILQSNHLHN